MKQASVEMARILIVDDDEAVASTLSLLLEMEGYQVSTAADGKRGLEQAQATRPDLLITDYRMPGMDGIELIRAVRGQAELKELPIILMSATLPQEIAQDAEPDERLKKPFGIEEVLAAVARLLGR